MKAKDKIAVNFFRKRIKKVSPTLADNARINEIIENHTADLTPSLQTLVKQRLGDVFKSIEQEYIDSNPQVKQLINRGNKE